MSFWDSVDHHIGDEHLEQFWMAHPIVRERINRRISGQSGLWPVDWLERQLATRAPLDEAVSIGCGTGGLERDLVGRGLVRRITGIDVVEQPVAHARQEADRAGLADRIEYLV